MSKNTPMALSLLKKRQKNNLEQNNINIEDDFQNLSLQPSQNDPDSDASLLHDIALQYILKPEEVTQYLESEAQKLKKAIDWKQTKSIEQYVEHLYLLDNLGFEEFVCEEFIQLYNKCVIENGMTKDSIEIILGAVNYVILYKIESSDLEVNSLKVIVGAVEDLGKIITCNNIEIKDQDLLQTLNNNYKKAQKLLEDLDVTQDNDENNSSRINDNKISPNPVRAKSWPLSNRELTENHR